MVTFIMRKLKYTETQTEDIEEALGMEGLRILPRKKADRFADDLQRTDSGRRGQSR